MLGLASVLTVIILTMFLCIGGLSFAAMDEGTAAKMAMSLGAIGSWLALLCLLVLGLSFAGPGEVGKCFPTAIAISAIVFFPLAIAAAAFKVSAPMKALSVLNAVTGALALLSGRERERAILAMASLCSAALVLSSWWIVSVGGARVVEAAIRFSIPRAVAGTGEEMQRIEALAPVYLDVVAYVLSVPLSAVAVLVGAGLASLRPNEG